MCSNEVPHAALLYLCVIALIGLAVVAWSRSLTVVIGPD